MNPLEQALGYTFRDPALLERALTHPSTGKPDNQRLEFLGDAVLEFCASDMLYRKYEALREGELTARRAALVCEETLSTLARALRLGERLALGHGEELMAGRERASILADAMEAVIAAVYLDGGIEAAQRLVSRLFAEEEALRARRGADDKGALQAYTQARELGLPEYEIVAEEGPPHDRRYVACVRVAGEAAGEGRGATKKAAEQAAAREALERLNQGD